ncbi:MAG: endonuclease/exonuclease/phosphatase family protein, partial [Bacteroidota bacterium]
MQSKSVSVSEKRADEAVHHSPVRTALKWAFWGPFYALDLLAVGVFTAGFLAAYLDPSWYWVGSTLAIGQNVWAFALMPFALVLLLARRWKGLAVHLALLLALFVRSGGFGSAVDPLPTGAPDGLRVMTFNTPRWNDNEETGDRMRRLADAWQPDLFGIQESAIWVSKAAPNALRGFHRFDPLIADGYTMQPPRQGPPDKNWYRWEVPALSRGLAVVEQEHLSWPNPNIDEGDHIFGLRTVYEQDGRRFVHYNVHLLTFGTDKPWEEEQIQYLNFDFWKPFLRMARHAFRYRSEQARHLRGLIEAEADPVILSGDFNSTPNSWTYRHLSQGFTDAYKAAGGWWGATYPTDWSAPILGP